MRCENTPSWCLLYGSSVFSLDRNKNPSLFSQQLLGQPSPPPPPPPPHSASSNTRIRVTYCWVLSNISLARGVSDGARSSLEGLEWKRRKKVIHIDFLSETKIFPFLDFLRIEERRMEDHLWILIKEFAVPFGHESSRSRGSEKSAYHGNKRNKPSTGKLWIHRLKIFCSSPSSLVSSLLSRILRSPPKFAQYFTPVFPVSWTMVRGGAASEREYQKVPQASWNAAFRTMIDTGRELFASVVPLYTNGADGNC